MRTVRIIRRRAADPAFRPDRQKRSLAAVIADITSPCNLKSTARAAHEHGYHVVLVTDAMTDGSAEAHHNSITRIFPRLGETATTEEVLEQIGEPS